MDLSYLPEIIVIALLALLIGLNAGRLLALWQLREKESNNRNDQSGAGDQ